LALNERASQRTVSGRILIVDDQPDILEALRLLLRQRGFQIELANSPARALEALRAREFDLLLMDMNYTRDTTSGREGFGLLSQVRGLDGTLPVVAMTAWGSVELAVESIHQGVGDFILKPWDNERLVDIVQTQITQGRARREAARLSEEEVRAAREIQQGLLPDRFPRIPGYDFSGVSVSARDVGGDYFDFFKFTANRVGLCIADVMGSGVPAALLMSNFQVIVKGMTSESVQPTELCSKLNRVICGSRFSGRFITFFYCLLNPQTITLVYANAGHPPPILARCDGSHLRLRSGGGPLGFFPDCNYAEESLQITPGDKLLLFTDGLTETSNSESEEFGEDGLIRVMREHPRVSAEELQKKIIQTVTEFGGGSLKDDATLVVISAMEKV
jgi:serine phosphatase RsbU (regulator of sigma subunit)